MSFKLSDVLELITSSPKPDTEIIELSSCRHQHLSLPNQTNIPMITLLLQHSKFFYQPNLLLMKIPCSDIEIIRTWEQCILVIICKWSNQWFMSMMMYQPFSTVINDLSIRTTIKIPAFDIDHGWDGHIADLIFFPAWISFIFLQNFG